MNEAIVAPHKNLKVTASLIAIIAPFIARNDIRYYLNGINIKPHKDGGAVICATNGHTLGAIYDAAATCEAEVILHLDARTVAACGAKSKETRALVIINNCLAVVDEANAEIFIQAGNPIIEGKFPDYSRVIPAEDKLVPGLIGNFNREYLRQIDVAAQACSKVAPKVRVHAPLIVAMIDELESFRAKAKPAKPKRNAYPIEFEVAWDAYPAERRGSKIAAHRAWLARVNAGVDPRSMADGLSKYLQHAKQTGKEVAYLYLLQTFFGPDEHFNTDWTVTAAMRKGGSGGSIGKQDYSAGTNADGSF